MNRFSAALLAGFLGTAPFLGVVRAFPKLNRLEIELIETAAKLVSSDAQTSSILAVVIPFSLGSVFALPYTAVWERGRVRPDAPTGAVLGLAHGLATVLARPVFRRALARPRPFRLPPSDIWVVGEIVTHALYGVTVALCYRVLTEPANLARA